MSPKRLGEWLVEHQLINRTQLERALMLQQKSGGRLGEIIIAQGWLGHHALYQAIAAYYQLPFANLITSPPQWSLMPQKPDQCFTLQALPWRKVGDVLQIAVVDNDELTVSAVKQLFGDKVELVITSPLDIRRSIQHHYESSLENESRFSLWDRYPEFSARFISSPKQKLLLANLAIVVALAFFTSPFYASLAFIILCHALYGISMLFKGSVFCASAFAHTPSGYLADEADERALPVYTILIPMYKEAASLPGMIGAMQRMDYPASKLDIKLVLEADDNETYDAACALKPSYHFDIIRVPPSKPRTKPKACNYALRFARGEFVTVFDADDRPDPQQLKKAVAAFRALPSNVACLQARLNYYNAQQNILTRLFSLEYMVLFNFLLPGLERLGMPIPLGGTSNHVSLACLRDLGQWDPYNVTEDADLGTRMAALGLRTVMLDSYTMEEAPCSIRAWLNQRSRWIKGYMQTWLVHMRSPARLYKTLGFKGFAGFQLFIGLPCFVFITSPLVWGLSLAWASQISIVFDMPFPHWLLNITFMNFV